MFVTTLVASLPFKRDLRNSVWFWQSKDFTEVFLPSVRCWLPQLVAVKLWKLRPLKDGHLTGCFLCFCTIFLFKASLVILRAWWLWNLIFGLQIQKTLRVSLRNKSGLENFSRFSSWSFNLYSNQLFFHPQAIGGLFRVSIETPPKTGGWTQRGDVVAQHADPTGMVSWVGAREAQIPCENPVFSKFDSEAKQCAASS